LHGVGVELFVDTTDQLNAVDGAVAADYSVEDDFAFDVVVN
jgi:hypothetical protein